MNSTNLPRPEGRLVVKNYRCFSDEEPLRLPLSFGVVALVGANNSGKSAVARMIFEFQGLWRRIAGSGVVDANAHEGQLSGVDPTKGISDIAEVFCNRNDRPLSIEFEFDCEEIDGAYGVPYISRLKLEFGRISTSWTATFQLSNGTIPAHHTFTGLDAQTGVIFHRGNEPYARDPGIMHYASVFAEAVYISSDRSLLNIGAGQYLDGRFGSAAVSFFSAWKNGTTKAQTHAILGLTRKLGKVFGFRTLDISAGSNNEIQFIIDDQPYRQYEVGGGLSQFLACAISLLDQHPKLILIDEPETGLHPRLQLELVEYLESRSQIGVIFSTHSVGLARLSADVVLAFNKVSGNSIVKPLDAVGSLAQFVGEMSFSSWREIGFDALLVVEGPSEMRTIRQLLKLLEKDGRVALVHAGGRNLINATAADQLSEISRLSDNVAVLIDSERTSKHSELGPDRRAFGELCKAQGFKFHATYRRATENYFTKSAIQKVKGPSFDALGHYDQLKDAPNGWSKRDNWTIAEKLTLKELMETDLGEFLRSI